MNCETFCSTLTKYLMNLYFL